MEREASERTLLANMAAHRAEADALLLTLSDHWGYEDSFYRFYHHSFKVYHVQDLTERSTTFIKNLLPGHPLNEQFLRIVKEGTGRVFEPSHNRDWDRHTRPMVEAFLHARFMVEVSVRYSSLTEPPRPLPSGYAALLYLFNIR